MMKKVFLSSLVLLMSIKTFAQQTDQDAIRKTINTMFDAMRKGDSTLLRSTFAKEIVFQSISNKKNDSVALVTENVDDFIKAVGTPHNGVWDERVTFKDVKIDDALASVWAPYKFYLDSKFHHCGVDVFQLMKTTGEWKIIYIVDTRRKDNCLE